MNMCNERRNYWYTNHILGLLVDEAGSGGDLNKIMHIALKKDLKLINIGGIYENGIEYIISNIINSSKAGLRMVD